MSKTYKAKGDIIFVYRSDEESCGLGYFTKDIEDLIKEYTKYCPNDKEFEKASRYVLHGLYPTGEYESKQCYRKYIVKTLLYHRKQEAKWYEKEYVQKYLQCARSQSKLG